MPSWLSNTWSWIKDKYAKFEAWLNDITPGLKTRLCAGLGSVSSGAAWLQAYVTGMPTQTIVSAEKLAMASFILFTLAYFFHGLGDRVEDRE